MNLPRWACWIFLASCSARVLALDQNANQQSDVWEAYYGAQGLQGATDSDFDGVSNLLESVSGTDPFDATSRPVLRLLQGSGAVLQAEWISEPGKSYQLMASPDLTPGSWLPAASMTGNGGQISEPLEMGGATTWFFKLDVTDIDSDGDALTDWEEARLGLNAGNAQSNRIWNTTDAQQITAAWSSASVVTVGLLDGDMREDWPDEGMIALRRNGGVQPISVNVTITGSATRGTDYTTFVGSQVSIPLGAREVWIELTPTNDASLEGPESIIVTVSPGTGYSIGAINSATATLSDASSLPCAKDAARFLIQAAFGPDQDSAGDPDDVPENVEEVMNMGFDAWIDDQFSRPIGYLQPWVDWVAAESSQPGFDLHGNWKEFSWWARAMGTPKLRPDDVATQLPDPLRQRVAFALSQILVASDRPEALTVEQQGMANFYDFMVKHAFGNYRDLLYDVATHPVMGVYLSHLNNQKANPAQNTYPDENFAREVMQLFSIGLWQLETNGQRKTYPVGHAQAGEFIPTYTNSDITELARVFTGMTFANKNFPGTNGDYTVPMKMWDAYHDCNAKTLLGGFATPARTASSGSTGTAGFADIDAAIGNLFNHPNVGPFLALRLIQRLVTSNPSPDYIGRVAAKFNDNGAGVRGDMQAMVKAILMDPEARDPAMMDVPTWGKLREPFLRVVNMARAFNASSTSGYYALDQFSFDHLQDPMSAPSVFNFYLPAHTPPGPLTQLGSPAPEFQIINASTAITGPNYFWNAIGGNNLHHYGSAANYAVRLQSDLELGMIVPAAQIALDVPSGPAMDPDPLIRRLDLALTGGTLSPEEFQIIREAMLRIGTGSWKWHQERLRIAIYMIVTSADFNVLR